jgi:hypothetical protein
MQDHRVVAQVLDALDCYADAVARGTGFERDDLVRRCGS